MSRAPNSLLVSFINWSSALNQFEYLGNGGFLPESGLKYLLNVDTLMSSYWPLSWSLKGSHAQQCSVQLLTQTKSKCHIERPNSPSVRMSIPLAFLSNNNLLKILQFQFLDNQGHHRKDTGCQSRCSISSLYLRRSVWWRREPTNWIFRFYCELPSKYHFISMILFICITEK